MRDEIIKGLQQNPAVSVLVVGGGINGLGVFRDLAAQGVDVLLVEKGDYCSGTSAASTRVIHGGLRYLENGEFRLVREALKERAYLLNHAAHYVKPLPTTIPVQNWTGGMIHAARTFLGMSSKPGGRGAAIIKAGLTMYDAFAGSESTLPKHRFRSKQEALELRPQLTTDIVSTATYYDARVYYPERMGLELALDAMQENPKARALNYMSLHGAERGQLLLRDEISGEVVPVQPQVVVNATGAWIDFTNSAMHRPTNYIGGTKGSHLVLDHPELLAATRGEMLYFINSDGRICIFYQFYDRVIAGATDILVENPDEAVCDDDETAYILDSIRMVFPDINVTQDHIVFKFSGVRPLPRQDTATTGQISRDHRTEVLPPTEAAPFPVYSLVGGKWTTYRAFAEQVTDKVLTELNTQRTVDTSTLPIGGGRDYPADRQQWLGQLHDRTGVPTQRLDDLFERYGTQGEAVAGFICAGADAPLENHSRYSTREIEYILQNEHVLHLDDVILRRTLIGLLGELDRPLLEELASIAAAALGWDEARKADEIQRTVALFERKYGVSLA